MSIKWLVVGFLLCSLLATEPVSAQEKVLIDQVVAVVGNSMIKYSEVENQYLQSRAQGITFVGDGKCQLLEELLIQKLLVNQAQLDSVEVTEKEVEGELDRRLQTFIMRAGGRTNLETYFGKNIQEIKEDLRDIIREQLLTQRMTEEISGDVKVTPFEVEEYFKSIPTGQLPLINAEIELYQIVKNPMITAEKIESTKEKLREMRLEIMSAKDPSKMFRSKAIAYSEDQGSAINGGELGLQAPANFVPEFASVLNRLKVGEISDIVETPFGYHLIQLIDRTEGMVNARHILIKPRIDQDAKNRTQKYLDSLLVVLRSGKQSFEEVAALASDDETTRKNGGLMINPYTNTSRFEISQLDPTLNYAVKDMQPGELSEPFYTTDLQTGKEVYKIIMVKSRTKAHVANLKDDYQQIQDMALERKKQRILEEWIRERLLTTYINIDPMYLSCPFRLEGWIK